MPISDRLVVRALLVGILVLVAAVVGLFEPAFRSCLLFLIFLAGGLEARGTQERTFLVIVVFDLFVLAKSV